MIGAATLASWRRHGGPLTNSSKSSSGSSARRGQPDSRRVQCTRTWIDPDDSCAGWRGISRSRADAERSRPLLVDDIVRLPAEGQRPLGRLGQNRIRRVQRHFQHRGVTPESRRLPPDKSTPSRLTSLASPGVARSYPTRPAACASCTAMSAAATTSSTVWVSPGRHPKHLGLDRSDTSVPPISSRGLPAARHDHLQLAHIETLRSGQRLC